MRTGTIKPDVMDACTANIIRGGLFLLNVSPFEAMISWPLCLKRIVMGSLAQSMFIWRIVRLHTHDPEAQEYCDPHSRLRHWLEMMTNSKRS